MHRFQVDLIADKPVSGGPRSKMWQVKYKQCETEYQIFSLCLAQTLQITNWITNNNIANSEQIRQNFDHELLLVNIF